MDFMVTAPSISPSSVVVFGSSVVVVGGRIVVVVRTSTGLTELMHASVFKFRNQKPFHSYKKPLKIIPAMQRQAATMTAAIKILE
jgi:hypothetical protein